MLNTRKEWLIAGITLMLFLALRLPAIHQPYHQDEYRWATIANPLFHQEFGSHPPMNQVALSVYGRFFGYDTLRVVPLMFSFGGLMLIYLISIALSSSRRIGLIAALLYSVNIYSVIAGLQIDIDGAILPFFVLLAYWAYLKVLDGDKRFRWLLVAAILGGLLTKLSFVLCLAALAVDVFLCMGGKANKSISTSVRFLKKNIVVVGLTTVSIVLGIIIACLLYAAEFSSVVAYASHFKSFNFGSRAYGDLGFKVVKSLFFASPLLVLVGIAALGVSELRQRYRFWWIYLGLNLMFYLVLFDFAKLTVERYFMFLIAPLCIIAAGWIGGEIYNLQFTIYNFKKVTRMQWAAMGVLLYVLMLIITIPHDALPLNPKNAYVNHLLSLRLNFLIPFTGGSGPVGFYFSALFIAVTFGFSMLLIVLAWRRQAWNEWMVLALLLVGIGYNLFFDTEYLFGFFYGSVPSVEQQAIEYVVSHQNIKEVITYYDHGAYYLQLAGKYSARFYTAPTRDYTDRLTEYRGHYMVVDFPEIDKASLYWKLISRCPAERQFSDGYVYAYIFDCTSLPSERSLTLR